MKLELMSKVTLTTTFVSNLNSLALKMASEMRKMYKSLIRPLGAYSMRYSN